MRGLVPRRMPSRFYRFHSRLTEAARKSSGFLHGFNNLKPRFAHELVPEFGGVNTVAC